MKTRPLCSTFAAFLAAILMLAASPGRAADPDLGWVTTWTTVLIQPTFVFSDVGGNYGFKDRTLRLTTFASAGGSKVRLHLSNRFGTKPLVIGAVAVGPRHKPFNSDLVPSAIKHVTFAGNPGVTIPAGEEIVSDPADLDIFPNQVLAVDIYLPEATGPLGFNFFTNSTSYIAEGNLAGSASGKSFTPMGSWYVLAAIDVLNPKSPGTIVACCDSVSMTGQLDAFARWPEVLSRELQHRYGTSAPSVVHTTLSGQRLLTTSHYAESVVSRFERTVLDLTNVKAVILFVGVNDLGVPQMPPVDVYSPTNDVTAEEMIEGYKKVVAMARSRGIPIFGTTVTPGSGYVHQGHAYWSPAQEVKRRVINKWLRSTTIYNQVFDFAAAVQNPYDEEYYQPGASTDNIHPTDSGQFLLAQSVDIDKVMNAIQSSKGKTDKK